ncbi:MAG: hypothetical protein K6G10_12235 [Butyrivibrio sp.]|nr:hypothetical protein [Butyrivibrio sp.]
MDTSSSNTLIISITKNMLHGLCAVRSLNYGIWDDRLSKGYALKNLIISQNGTNTVYDFSSEKDPRRIFETLNYLDMYFMQENDEAHLSFAPEETL